jgi:guanylate kinase
MASAIIISGPSGAGKSTVLKRLFDKYPTRFAFSVSHTTRSPRDKEVHGEHYHFVPRHDFEKLRDENGFMETAEFSGNLYGTSFATVKGAQKAGKTCILDIEMEGVKQIKKSGLKARYLSLQPPSLEILEERLRARKTDTDQAIQKRLAKASVELAFAKEEGMFDKIVVNDDLDKASQEVEEFCLVEV